MKKIIFLMSLAAACIFLSLSAFASNTLGAVNDYLARQDFYNQINVSRNPATTIEEAGEEMVSAYNGSVAYSKNELTLPGKGGHNLNVTRFFNTAQNIDVNGLSTSYRVSSNTSNSSNPSDSIKYAFKYYLNGDTKTEPLYIAYDTIYDMLEAENGNNSIFLSEEYDEMLVDFDGTSYYYWAIEPNAENGLTLDSSVLAYEHAESGNIEFERDLSAPVAEIYTVSASSYQYTHSNVRNLDSYIGSGWEYKVPMLQDVDEEITSEKADTTTYVTNACFYDPEWNYALDVHMKYVVNDETLNTAMRSSYLYDYKNSGSSVSVDERSKLYDVRFQAYDENGEMINRTTITRCDGKKFNFEWYEELKSIEDAYGNTIYYHFDYPRDIITITDTLNRTIVLRTDGITVNGETIVNYTHSVINDYDVDPYSLLYEDNRYEFKATYKLSNDENKEILYKMKPAGRTVVIAETDKKINNRYNPERQTLSQDKLLIDEVELSTGAKIKYEYDEVMREEYVAKKVEDQCVSKKYILQNDTAEQENIYTYSYSDGQREINEPGGKKITENYVEKDGYIASRITEITDKDYTCEEVYTQERTCEGNYLPSKTVITETNGNNSFSVTEEYLYGGNQRISQKTRDGVIIYIAVYGSNDIPTSEKTKRADGEWLYVENDIEDHHIIETTYSTRNDSTTTLTTGYSNTYTYDAYGDLTSSTVDGVTTNYTYTYGDYSADEEPQYSLIVTKTIPSVTDVINSNGEKVTSDITETAKYDCFGNLVESTDVDGNVTSYTYDKLSRLLSTTYPDNSTETASYNDVENIVTVTDRAGKITILSFSEIGQDIGADIIAGEEEYTYYTKEYDTNGNLSKYTIYESDDPVTEIVYEYYSDKTLKSQKVYSADTDALLSEQTYSYNEITDTSERVDTTTIKKSDEENLVVKKYTDIYGLPTKSTAGNENGSLLRTETFTTDLLGNVLSITDDNENTISYTYDYKNRVLKETNDDGDFKYTYTGANLTKTTDRRGYSTTYTYDERGLKSTETNPTSNYVKHYYDAVGNVCRTETGKEDEFDVTEYRYDNMNNLIFTITHPTAETSVITKYTYDNCGNMTSMITGLSSLDETVNPAIHSVTTYAYDIHGNCISETDPLGNTKSATYNTLGYVTAETDKMGQTASYTYDALMRQTQRNKGNESVSYIYDYYGNITDMLDSSGQVSYAYDVLGNMLSETKGTTSKSYTYDAVGNRLTMDVSANDYSRSYSYKYTDLNRVSTVTSGEQKYSFTYNDEGNVTKLLSKKGASVRLTTEYTYDKSGRLTSVGNKPYNKTNVTSTATYNYAGNIITSKTAAGYVDYTYDGSGRLLTETDSDDNVTEYTYDLRGNRVGKTTPTEIITYTYDLANKLLSQTKVSGDVTEVTSYTYDLNGNLISRQCGTDAVTYTYTPFGMLASVTDSLTQTTTSYTYDGNNLRQTKTVTSPDGTSITTKFLYDGTNLIAEIKDAENQISYIYANGISGINVSGTDYYLNKNVFFDVDKITNTSGATVQSVGFDAFGNKSVLEGTELCPVGYRGEYQDLSSGLIYLRNRYYDPSIGRFISEDPAKDGLNWYVYCENNPINRIDPSGLYDRDAAVQYAVKWHDGTNTPAYERFDTVGAFLSSLGRMRGDCANFVSQCLVAGGLTMNTSWHYYSKMVEEWHGNNSIQKKERDMTSAWASASGQYEFFSSDWAGYKNGEVIQIWSKEGMEYNIKYNNIQKGDLMFFAHRDTGEVYHSTIISDVTNNEIKYAAHTSERDYEPLSKHLQNDFVVIVRIRDEAVRGYTE